jgi:hypothetical protein
MWWYEPFSLSRRLIIVCLVVFLNAQPQVLWPLLLAALIIFQLVQILCRPFNSWIENIAEEVSLSALIFITSVNIVQGSDSFVASDADGSSTRAVAGLSLAVFLCTVVVILFALVVNHWLTKLIVRAIGLEEKLNHLKKTIASKLKRKRAE